METPTFVLLLLVTLPFYLPSIWKRFLHNRKLRSIPTVGPSGTLLSYIGAIRHFFHGTDMVQEGYNKFYGSFFKVPTFTSWVVVATGTKLVDEIRRAPDDALSAMEAVKELLYLDLTVGSENLDNPFHVDVVRKPLTQNIGAIFADVRDEVMVAFEELVPATDEWTRITAYPTMMNIVCRASNRMLVGLPLCRNPDWLKLNKTYTIKLFKTSIKLGFVPPLLRPIAAPLLSHIPNSIKRGTKLFEPLFRERLEEEAKYGEDWPERPNDGITWMLEVTKGKQKSVQDFVMGLLSVNFASIHTTTKCLTYTMYELATRPEYVQPLRDEIEAIIKEEGWSKESVHKLRKLDSFIKESLRLSSFTFFTMIRKALRDYTFSNGTTIPAGSTIAVPFNSLHTDANDYTDPNVFDGFRFEKLREKSGEDSKHQLISLSTDYVLFGHGRHACPGRFFAANELKIMLAHVVMNYDIKMADGGGRPEDWKLGVFRKPNTSAQMLFRKRRAS